METVVGDISGAIQQLKNLSDVTLEECCDELTRGVVDGVSESDGSNITECLCSISWQD